MRKQIIYIPVLILSFMIDISAWADLPYMPLELNLTTVSDNYFEGDKIDFILTIKNKDKTNTYPILTPGGMNSGNKIIYLRVYDPDEKIFILRAMESREMSMNIKHLGKYGLIELGPGKEISIPFSWNDSINYWNKVESHHSLDKPLFAGTYMFQAFYDPFGTIVGDTLYHLMTTTEDEQSKTKLNFLGPELSFPCKVQIKKRSGDFKIDGIKYKFFTLGNNEEGALYYFKNEWDKYGFSANCIREVSFGDGAYPRAEVSHTYYGKGPYNGNLSRLNELIFRDDKGNITNYTLSDEAVCPENYFSRVYHLVENEIRLYQQTDTLPDGTRKTIIYNDDLTINQESMQSMNTYKVITIYYFYKSGKLIRKNRVVKGNKTKLRKREPCEIIAE